MKIPVFLKIDFKFDDGTLRIIDVGPGLSADRTFFAEDCLEKMLRYAHETTGAVLAPIYGEFPHFSSSARLKSMPILLRDPQQLLDLIQLKQLPEEFKDKPIIPYTRLAHLSIFMAYAWKQYNNNQACSPPLAFAPLVGDKIFWYLLLHQFLPEDKKPKISFWSNDEDPADVVNHTKTIGAKHGFFIKVATNSVGGAEDIFYVADDKALIQQLSVLHKAAKAKLAKNPENKIKKIFVIEPCYVNPKPHKMEYYNPTGRAFLSLVFDTESKKVEVDIAQALWIHPKTAMTSTFSQSSMLTNVRNNNGVGILSKDEMQLLAQGLQQDYAAVWTHCFQQDDLFTLFADAPIMQKWLSWFSRDRNMYSLTLDHCRNANDAESAAETMFVLAGNFALHVDKDFFTVTLPLDDLLSTPNEAFTAKKDIPSVLTMLGKCSFQIQHEKFLSITTDPRLFAAQKKFAAIYLLSKSKHYDGTDFNRALRQAALLLDIPTAKVLIYTHLANVNDVAPASKKTALDIAQSSQGKDKDLFIQLLKQVGAKNAVAPQNTHLFKPTKTLPVSTGDKLETCAAQNT